MKTRKLTLTTHYFGRKLNIRMDAEKADRLMSCEYPLYEVDIDLDIFCARYEMRYLTESQARKIIGFNNDNDYFDKIDYTDKKTEL